jgi:hypothetical protein
VSHILLKSTADRSTLSALADLETFSAPGDWCCSHRAWSLAHIEILVQNVRVSTSEGGSIRGSCGVSCSTWVISSAIWVCVAAASL